MSLAFGFALPHWQPLSGGFSPASLFAGGTAGAWYDPSDLTTLFTTSAGTTQCAMPGLGSAVSVGLMLDKSQGLVLGSELANAATQTLATATGTQSGAGWNITATGSFAILSQPSIIAAGKWYKYTVSWSGNTNGRTIRFLAGGNGGSNSPFSFGTSASGTGTVIVSGGTQNTSAYFQINDSVNGDTFYLEITSVRELPGNHAIAFNDNTKRPVLMARVNLLTYSEDFSNAAWGTGAGGGASISKGTTTGVRPDGTTGTVHTLTFSAVSAGQFAIAFQAAAQAFLNVQLTSSLYVRVASGTATIYLNLEDSGTAPSGTNFVAGSAQTVTTSWQRISLTGTRATAPNAVSVVIGFDTRAAAGQTNAAPFTLEVWGADLRPTNIGANVPAYQRIADANTYDTSGFPLYLFFDGADDSMYTPANLNLSGTDKATVFAGIRRLNVSGQFVVEFSSSSDANNGAFAIGADSSGFEYFFNSRGTTLRQILVDNAAYNVPVSNVATLSADIAAPSMIAWLNGTQVGSNTNSQGTGNYGSYPLFIGSRNNSIYFLNGHLHSLIIAGSAVSAGNISATEQWVAGKTGIQI